jgi:hypothetical protein
MISRKPRARQRSVVIGLPARSCRTFAFSAPTEDRQLLWKMAFAHVEKRGLTSSGVEQTPFECRFIEQGGGRSLVSVDVVTPEAAGTLTDVKARAVIPSARVFTIPDGKLVVVEEQGRLVLCAGVGGRVVHTQIVAATRDFAGVVAPEIRIASLALRQQASSAKSPASNCGRLHRRGSARTQRGTRSSRRDQGATASGRAGITARGECSFFRPPRVRQFAAAVCWRCGGSLWRCSCCR